MSENSLVVAYIAASALFIFSIGGLSKQETAQKGNLLGILGMLVVMRIINPTDQAVTYRGYFAGSPQVKRQQWVDGKWQDAKVDEGEHIKPGLNVRDITIPAGHSALFAVGLSADMLPSRVGLDYIGQGKAQFTVWSDKVER